MKILGLDCGTKNLGVAIVEFDHDWPQKNTQIRELLRDPATHTQALIKLRDTFKGLLTLRYAGKFDLIPNKKMRESNALERAKRLKGALTALDTKYGPFDLILVEYQMGPNNKAQDISSQIIMHYSTADFNITETALHGATLHGATPESKTNANLSTCSPKIRLVGPSLKNSIWIGAKGGYGNFIQKYNSSYSANKAHTTYNFETYCTLFGIPIAKVKRACLRDAADAFMMILAVIYA